MKTREEYRGELWNQKGDSWFSKMKKIITELGEVENVNETGVYLNAEEKAFRAGRSFVYLTVKFI